MSKQQKKRIGHKHLWSAMVIVMLFAIIVGATAGCQAREETDSYADSEDDYTERESDTLYADVEEESVSAEDISEPEPETDTYALYAEVVQEYEDTYGEGACIVEYEYGSGNASYIMNGTYLVQLLDFNGDGQEELLIGVCTDSATSWVDVWAYEDGEVVKVYSPELQAEESLYTYGSGYAYYNIAHGSDIGLYVEYTSYNGKIYLIQGFRGSSEQYYYFEYIDGTFRRVKTIEILEDDNWTPQIDGQTVTDEEWSSELALWNDGLVSYLVRGGGAEMGDTLLEITAKTKAILGMEAEETDLAAYASVLQQYEETYGAGGYQEYEYAGYGVTGTYFAQLLDFDGDGVEELLVGVYDKDNYSNITSVADGYRYPWVEIWALLDGNATKVYSPDMQCESAGTNNVFGGDISTYIAYTVYDGRIYMLQGTRGYAPVLYYYGYIDGEFQLVRSVDYCEADDYYSIDGVSVTQDEFEAEQEAWDAGLVLYCVFGATEDQLQTVSEITAQTKALLGMGDEETDLTVYADVVQQYEDTYGTIGYNTYYQNREAQTGEAYMLTGLCLVQPIDFDGDSVYELLIGYGETVDASTGQTEVYGDVWGLDGDTPVLLYSGASFPGESYYNAIAYKNEDGVYYLYDGYSENRFAHVDIYCLTDGSFTKVYTLEADFSGDSPLYTMNGTAISMTEYAGYVSDGLTEFYAQVSSLEAFETCRDDLISVFNQMGLK
ncbi:MAG: hypothetical protein LUE21_12110 [Oscillospiraceae bacterium]|nr:hypothetical protein [Oscillospiraceae bacterium]